jgi:xanthine dehydrogenase YagS FAD-binding subunit
MTPISYSLATTVDAAVNEMGALSAQHASEGAAIGATRFIAGGTNLIDLMKENVMRPTRLIDVSRIEMSRIEMGEKGNLMLGATARNADTAYHPLVSKNYPLLSAAILAGASPQLRNMATNGGNLLQRTRCYYFYDAGVPCNKRQPGTGCPAIGGVNRLHAILGASDQCIATHPSDMCVALAALRAIVHVQSVRGDRQIPFDEFHRLPGDRPDVDTTLLADELITHIELPNADNFVAHSAYLKLRDRASYSFALVSVAAALDIADDGAVRGARLALGGVAHKPWRMPEAEQLLLGRPAVAASFAAAADVLLDGAIGQGVNDFKIPMAHRAIVRALEVATNGTVTNHADPKPSSIYDTGDAS